MTENQGKRKSQMDDSETFLFIAILTAVIGIIVCLLTSCTSTAQEVQEEKVYININGNNVELVADEYGGQYLKQVTAAGTIYIPYIGVVEEPSDSLKFYNAKNK